MALSWTSVRNARVCSHTTCCFSHPKSLNKSWIPCPQTCIQGSKYLESSHNPLGQPMCKISSFDIRKLRKHGCIKVWWKDYQQFGTLKITRSYSHIIFLTRVVKLSQTPVDKPQLACWVVNHYIMRLKVNAMIQLVLKQQEAVSAYANSSNTSQWKKYTDLNISVHDTIRMAEVERLNKKVSS